MRGDYPIPPSRDLLHGHPWSAERTCSPRLPSDPLEAPSEARVSVVAAATLVLVVGTASAFGTVRDLVLGAPAKSQIAFGSFRNGQFDAYVMNTDGSG